MTGPHLGANARAVETDSQKREDQYHSGCGLSGVMDVHVRLRYDFCLYRGRLYYITIKYDMT